jgi:hypothetical protein
MVPPPSDGADNHALERLFSPRFVPARPDPARSWRRPVQVGRLAALTHVPIAETEILQLSHVVPIVIEAAGDVPRVVALLDPRLQKLSPFDAAGKWRHAYQPLGLRALPFRLSGSAAEGLQLEELAGVPDDLLQPPQPFIGTDGRISRPFKEVLAILQRIRDGAERLREAAERLIAADLLRPLDAESDALDGMMVCDTARLSALSKLRTATLSKGGYLALDLAIASHFSTRLLIDRFRQQPGEAQINGGRMVNSHEPVLDLNATGAGVDQSALFSIDEFLKARGP